eukprot:scaffold2009_cov370-Prasinococcus_capsulatus_cf.AAC.8
MAEHVVIPASAMDAAKSSPRLHRADSRWWNVYWMDTISSPPTWTASRLGSPMSSPTFVLVVSR